MCAKKKNHRSAVKKAKKKISITKYKLLKILKTKISTTKGQILFIEVFQIMQGSFHIINKITKNNNYLPKIIYTNFTILL